jgi:hypothetical protein
LFWLSFATVAVKSWVLFVAIEEVVGEMLMDTAVPGGGGVVPETNPEHPERKRKATTDAEIKMANRAARSATVGITAGSPVGFPSGENGVVKTATY